MPADYQAPLREMQFVVTELCDFNQVAALPGQQDLEPSLAEAVLSEAARFSQEVLSPLNVVGDQSGAQVNTAGEVSCAPGFKQAYSQFVEAGWNGLSCSTEYDGQGLPQLVAAAVNEMWNASCMSFALCPMLTAGAIHALERHGSETQKRLYLPKMVSGEWTGTMNLTEPQAGSDLAAVATKAWPLNESGPSGEPGYCIHGTKIYITYGNHDLTENIIHLVLARLPDAPEGVKGISLFVVPKHHVTANGELGGANDLKSVSLEHKLGIHASPTAVMSYGEASGAVGYLVGEPHRGLEYMFTMMNDARLQVGIQGLAISERAYQQALAYAHERIQGRVLAQSESKPIAYHPDVCRLLGQMKSRIDAMRALAYEAAAMLDMAAYCPDPAQAAAFQSRGDFLIPVVKAWCTESSTDLTSMAVQVHGGMGYVEETGAAQHFRDARITTIYEGTTAIQANDFLGRKLARDKGAEARRILQEVQATARQLAEENHDDCKAMAAILLKAVAVLEESIQASLEALQNQQPVAAFMGSVPLVMLSGYVLGGWMMGRAALVAYAKQSNETFYGRKLKSASFYCQQVLLPQLGLAHAVKAGQQAYDQVCDFTQA
jgi:alkylation response protein AidB-like acyl-CoA dehydrogenase